MNARKLTWLLLLVILLIAVPGGIILAQGSDMPEITYADFSLGEKLMIGLSLSLFMGMVAALLSLFAPLRMRRVSDAALSAPIGTFGMGLLTFIVFGAIVVASVILTAVTLVAGCLLPFVGLFGVIIVFATLMGWAGVSLPMGATILAQLGVRPVSPLAATTVGAVALHLIPSIFLLSGWTAPLYFIAAGIIGSWGLGSALLTRAGGQAYPMTAWRSPGRQRI